MADPKHSNRLINSTSPYLLQHAHNPVDWYEWGEEALLKARKENKPILVSIGYSSCHWCHVMEREVFEKDDMAKIMNDYLVCIKVDREERPDVDQIYMDAVQAMGVQGGWPLNVFLTPDQKPFYGGTYFPPQQWLNVLDALNRAFTQQRDEIEKSANDLAEHLRQQDTTRFKKEHDASELKDDLQKTFSKLEPAFDTSWGGLEKAPKFVMPSVWLWLFRYHHLTKNENALRQLLLTLKRIGMGGIYDQVGGGFARYSVDGYWFAPHFEKMLYDNAQLLSLFAEGYALTKSSEFKTILEETFEWLQTEMMHPDGGFYSALDADSEGEEGKFYVWKMDEIKEILQDDAAIIADYYSIKEEGNWEHGSSILFRTQPDEKFMDKHKLTADQWHRKLRATKDKLLRYRDKRIRPGLDDKIITSWNAMTVIGLSDAFKATGNRSFVTAATKTMQFLERELMEGSTIFRSFKNKRSATKGFLDDYAYVILASTRLYEVTFDEYWIERARLLVQHTIDNFFDSSDGFFNYSGRDSEKLIADKKEIFDNVIPASNSVMAQALWRMGVLCDNDDWKRKSTEMTLSLSHLIVSEPNYMSNWGINYLEIRKGLAEVAFVGAETVNLANEFTRTFQPFSQIMGATSAGSLPLLQGKTSVDGKTTIYVCYDRTCQRPVHNVPEALSLLR
jgi:uncharacterized protein